MRAFLATAVKQLRKDTGKVITFVERKFSFDPEFMIFLVHQEPDPNHRPPLPSTNEGPVADPAGPDGAEEGPTEVLAQVQTQHEAPDFSSLWGSKCGVKSKWCQNWWKTWSKDVGPHPESDLSADHQEERKSPGPPWPAASFQPWGLEDPGVRSTKKKTIT